MGVGRGLVAAALALVAIASAGVASAGPLAPGVEVDWTVGAISATAVGPADRNAPSPAVAHVAAVRAAERLARERLGRALAAVPTVGAAIDPASAAVARELAAAPVVTVVRGTDGSARVTVQLGVEALRQASAGPRVVRGDDGAPARVVIDARATSAAPRVGLAITTSAGRWQGPVLYATAVPTDATAIVATGASADAVAIAGAAPPTGAVVVVVVRSLP